MSITAQQNINAFSSDKFKLSLSNVPTLKTDITNIAFLYENFCRSITLPDFNLELTTSDFKGSIIHHSVSRNNDDLSDLLIEFKLDEKGLNYGNLVEYIQRLRYGDLNNVSTRQYRDQLARNYTIKAIDVSLLDNQNRPQFVISFKECFIRSISSISLQHGVSEDVSFTINVAYEQMLIEDVPA
jgi:hypothetical protein